VMCRLVEVAETAGNIKKTNWVSGKTKVNAARLADRHPLQRSCRTEEKRERPVEGVGKGGAAGNGNEVKGGRTRFREKEFTGQWEAGRHNNTGRGGDKKKVKKRAGGVVKSGAKRERAYNYQGHHGRSSKVWPEQGPEQGNSRWCPEGQA